MSAIIGQCPITFANAAIDKIAHAKPEQFGLSSIEIPDREFKEMLVQSLCGLANGHQPQECWCGDALKELGLIGRTQIRFSDGTPPEVRFAIEFDNYRQALWSLGAEGLLKFMDLSGTFEANAD